MREKKDKLPDYIDPHKSSKYEDRPDCETVVEIVLMGSFFLGIFTGIMPLVLIGFVSFIGIVIYHSTFKKWQLDREDAIEQQLVYNKIRKEKGKKYADKELKAYRDWYKNKYHL